MAEYDHGALRSKLVHYKRLRGITARAIAEEAGLPLDRLAIAKVSNAVNMGCANPDVRAALFIWIARQEMREGIEAARKVVKGRGYKRHARVEAAGMRT